MSYFLSSMLTIFISITTLLVGKWFSLNGKNWYKKLKTPHFSPPRFIYSVVWTSIFALATVSALLVLQAPMPQSTFNMIIFFFILNAALNISWNWLFFYHKNILGALLNSIAMLGTVLVLIHMIRPFNCGAALMLVPYAVWLCYAIVLNDTVWQLNKPHRKGFSFKDFFKKQSI